MNSHLEPEHILSADCWCRPRVVRYDAQGQEIVVREGCGPIAEWAPEAVSDAVPTPGGDT